MSNRNTGTITVNLADDTRIAAMRTVLSYESVMRGISMSQAFVDMILEAVDVAAYPEEVRAELSAIEEERLLRAAVRATKATELARSA